MISTMKKTLLVCFTLCIFQKYFFFTKNNIKLPKDFLIIPYELEPYQIEHIYYLFQ